MPMKMELTVSSKTSAIRTQTPGNYPKRNKLHLEHGKSLKTNIKIKLKMTIHTNYSILWKHHTVYTIVKCLKPL